MERSTIPVQTQPAEPSCRDRGDTIPPPKPKSPGKASQGHRPCKSDILSGYAPVLMHACGTRHSNHLQPRQPMARPSSTTAQPAAQTICPAGDLTENFATRIGGGGLTGRLGATVFRTMRRLLLAGIAILPALTVAGQDDVQAGTRDNATNFKDMALAACVSAAYNGSAAGKDASITASVVFLNWTNYDIEKEAGAVDALVHKYLARDYSNPFEGYEHAKFDMLKCIDMYHSRELNDLVRKYVPHPAWIGDAPAKRKKR